MRPLSSNLRLWLLAPIVLGCFGAVGVRLHHLQVVQHEAAVTKLAEVRRQVQVLPARRGDIVDRHGERLATSRSLAQVGYDPQMLKPEDRAKLPELARLLGLDPVVLEAQLFPVALAALPAAAADAAGEKEKAVRWVKLADDVEEDAFERVRELKIKAVYGNRVYRRLYPNGGLAAHVVGYVNREFKPAMGVEAVMDFYLRGQEGWRESERDGLRREMPQFRTREVPAADGYTVELSLDAVVQHIAEKELEQVVEAYRPQSACILVGEPATGFLLAMASWPSFDLNQFNTAPLDRQRNRAISDILEPGSTFKAVTVAAALEEGVITPQDRFDCTLTSLLVQGVKTDLPDESRAGEFAKERLLSVSEIVSKSSNIGSAQIGVRLGRERMYRYARAFGYGERSGFALEGEVAGLLNPFQRWLPIDLTRIPIGHSVSATPLQVHAAMSALANEGVLMRPQIVRRVIDSAGQTVANCEPLVRRRVVSARTAKVMCQLLAGVMTRGGTGSVGELPGYEAAGKTGTTQKIIDGRHSSDHHIALFSGFFPASAPRLAVTIIIDDAQTKGTAYAAKVAVPSLKRVSEQLIPYLAISPPRAAVGLALR